MNMRLFIISVIILLLPSYVPTATALTIKQFSDICDSSPGECSEHPMLQAYVGGALDLLATLDEKTDYLDKLYCKEPKELFDVPNIIRFMTRQGEEHATENAMLVLVRYFEEQGGCDHK